VTTRQQIGDPLTTTGAVGAVTFSPDGNTLATSSGSTVQLWDVATHRQIGSTLTSSEPVNAVAFSPDGNTLGAGSGDPGG
jgi:WD40 repeat protein